MLWIKDWDLILLDMDGLLVDTEGLHFQSYKEALARFGVTLDWDFGTYCRYAHESTDRLRRELQQRYPQLVQFAWDEVYEAKRMAYHRMLERTPVDLMPGVERLLKRLQENGQRHCVVTHSRPYEVELIRKYQPLVDAIPFWVTRDQYSQPKPHPEGYLLAQKLYGKPGDRVIGFEDGPRGMVALRAAGVAPVWVVPVSNHPAPWAGVIRWNSFEEIPVSGPEIIT